MQRNIEERFAKNKNAKRGFERVAQWLLRLSARD
jgi:hypothetical protein